MVTELVQAPDPRALKTAIDAMIADGKTIHNVFVLADRSWYLVLRSA